MLHGREASQPHNMWVGLFAGYADLHQYVQSVAERFVMGVCGTAEAG
jgi:hypothetical protein